MTMQYIGRRYVPKLCGNWDNTLNTEYESLSVVYYKGMTYTSKKDVPIGIDLTNEEYWMKSADYNEQLAVYRDEQTHLRDEFDTFTTTNNTTMQTMKTEQETFINNVNTITRGYDATLQDIQTEQETLNNTVNNLNKEQRSLKENTNTIMSEQKSIKMFSQGTSAQLISIGHLSANINMWLQSFVYNHSDDILVACYGNKTGTNDVCIQKISMTDMTIQKEVSGLPYYHCNDITYNSRTNELIIATMDEENAHNKLVILDYDTLNKKREISVGSDGDLYLSAVAYNSTDDIYYCAMNGLLVLDSNFNIISQTEFVYNINLETSQNMEYYNGHIFMSYNNKVVVYDKNCNFVKNIKIHNSSESEGLTYYKDGYFLLAKIHGDIYQQPTLFKFNLTETAENIIYTYKTLHDIGLPINENTSIYDICKQMIDNSYIQIDVNDYSNLTTLWSEIPNRYSMLTIRKVTKARIYIECSWWVETTPMIYISAYRTDKNALPTFIQISGNTTISKSSATTLNGCTSVTNNIRKQNNFVELHVCITNIQDFTQTKIAQIPSGYRPSVYKRVLGACSGNNYCRFEVSTDGYIQLINTSITSPSSADWFELVMSYITD